MLKNVATTLIVYVWDSTTGLPKTGDAANLTAYRTLDFGSVTVLADTSAAEIDSTNAKGFYKFDLADSETNGNYNLYTCKSSTANMVCMAVPAFVHTLPTTGILAPTTAGRLLTVDASGAGAADVTKLLGTAWLTPGTAGTPDVNAKLIGATAQTGADVGGIVSSGTHGNAALKTLIDAAGYSNLLVRTTIASISAQSLWTLTAGSADDDAYRDCLIVIRDQSTAVQVAVVFCSSYTGSLKRVGCTSPQFTLATGDIVEIYADKAIKPSSNASVCSVSVSSNRVVAVLDSQSQSVIGAGTGLVIGSGIIGPTGNDTTHLHLDGLTFGDDELNDYLIRVYDDSESEYHSLWIEDWDLSDALATLDSALPFTPEDSTDTYTVLAIRRGARADLHTIRGQSITCSGGVTIPAATLASTTNITGGTITNLTNAPTNGDLTAAMKASVNAEADTALSDAGVTLARMGALTDWIDGGRLDLLLDAVVADNPNKPTRGVQFDNLTFIMVDATDFNTPETGITVTATISKDGGAFSACSNSVSEISAGAYKITLTGTEMTADNVLLKLTGTGCATRFIQFRTQPT